MRFTTNSQLLVWGLEQFPLVQDNRYPPTSNIIHRVYIAAETIDRCLTLHGPRMMIDPHSYDTRNSYHGGNECSRASYDDPMRLVSLEREDPWDTAIREALSESTRNSRLGDQLFDDHSLIKSLASIKNEDDLFIIKQIIREDEEEMRRQRRANPNDPVHRINSRIENTLLRVNKKLKRSRVGAKLFKDKRFFDKKADDGRSRHFRVPDNVRRSHWGSILFKGCH
jgi:hypothetical protein